LRKTKLYLNKRCAAWQFYVVASGVIHLSVTDAEETILNKCHEGSIFGLRAAAK
jgi:CBS domain-containing protein